MNVLGRHIIYKLFGDYENCPVYKRSTRVFQGSFLVALSDSSNLFGKFFGTFYQPKSIIMFAKLAILCAVVAVAYGGVVLASPPASTTLLANHHIIAQPALTLAHSPAVVRTVAAAPAATVVAAAPTVIQTGTKIVQTVEPVEQHGYRIAY